jgi:heavy metal translocating P-type ATPase
MRGERDPARRRLTPSAEWAVAGTLLGALAGGLCHLLGAGGVGDMVWRVTIVATVVPVAWSVVRALRHGDLGVDVIALLAMVGALIGDELLAGAIVAVMLTGGNALESYASGRAQRELTALLRRAPQVAHRREGDAWVELPVGDVAVGDVLLVRAGEVVPVDGRLASERASVDTSAMTGEPLPVIVRRGEVVRSGTANAAEAFELRASHGAEQSSYAALVRLVQEAQRGRAPFTRMADRYAVLFLVVTLLTAGFAWALSGDGIRALAVLVVATPCPLILAAPVAFVAGLSRAAGRGVMVKSAAALERLAQTRTVLLDKTGTLTSGQPVVEQVTVFGDRDEDELVALAASADQLSAHVLAEAIVHDAQRHGLRLLRPRPIVEQPGSGVVARVDGHRVGVGGERWLASEGFALPPGAPEPAADRVGRAIVHVGVDDELAGALVMADRLRPDAAAVVAQLHDAGVKHVAMVTGDRADIAQEIASRAGLDRVYAEQSPEEKLAVVRAARARPELRPVVMVGDGVNDAPALALADVGIALAGESRTVSSEAADAVITVDRVDRVVDAVRIGQRTMTIARQSVIAGIALSVGAMGFAAAGYLPPVAGALLQEAIDVAVILNALRALLP